MEKTAGRIKRSSIVSDEVYRATYAQFCTNFFFYIKTVGEQNYKAVCKERTCDTLLGRVRDFYVGRIYSHDVMMEALLQVADISGLPHGTWMFGDIQYLHKNGIIVLADKCSFHIAPMYLTDGIYFYSKHLDHAVPLGAKEEFQKMVDECFDLRVWKYRQPT